MESTELKGIRKNQVVKDNELIQTASYSLTAEEQKLLCYVISKIKPSDKEFTKYTISAADFAEICGIDKRNVYRDFKRMVDKLDDKSRWIQLGDSTVKFRVFNEPEYNPRQGSITLILNSKLQKYLIGLVDKKGARYTQYELWNILSLKSKYSIRLYELFKSYSYKQKQEFEIDKLRGLLCVENYTLYGDLKRRVLDKAIDEINRCTDLKVSIEPVTKGKEHKTVAVIFHITRKELNEKMGAYWETVNRINAKNKQIQGQYSIFDYGIENEIKSSNQITITGPSQNTKE